MNVAPQGQPAGWQRPQDHVARTGHPRGGSPALRAQAGPTPALRGRVLRAPSRAHAAAHRTQAAGARGHRPRSPPSPGPPQSRPRLHPRPRGLPSGEIPQAVSDSHRQSPGPTSGLGLSALAGPLVPLALQTDLGGLGLAQGPPSLILAPAPPSGPPLGVSWAQPLLLQPTRAET